MTQNDALAEQLSQLVADCAEFFECIQVLASFVDDNGNTQSYYSGTGNWHARQGMASDFLKQDAAVTFANEMCECECDDDGEEWANAE